MANAAPKKKYAENLTRSSLYENPAQRSVPWADSPGVAGPLFQKGYTYRGHAESLME
jgi:hypothetical protein